MKDWTIQQVSLDEFFSQFYLAVFTARTWKQERTGRLLFRLYVQILQFQKVMELKK